MKYLKSRLIHFLVRHYLHAITAEDVLKVIDGEYYLKGKPLNDETAMALKADFFHIKNSKAHNHLMKLLILMANDMMFIHPTNQNAQNSGRQLLFFIQQYDLLLDELSKTDT